MHKVRIIKLTGLVDYLAALKLQEKLHVAVKDGRVGCTLLQLEHHDVYTIGKRGSITDIKMSTAELRACGTSVYHVGRGGQVTYHGPGQAVMYPIINVRALRIGARAFVEALEECMVCALGSLGIVARGQIPGRTGVWVGDAKIAALGVQISHGVSMHGVALNVSPDLSRFRAIVPCGLPEAAVTSIQHLIQHKGSAAVAAAVRAPAAPDLCPDLVGTVHQLLALHVQRLLHLECVDVQYQSIQQALHSISQAANENGQ